MNIARHPELLDRLAAAYALGTLRGGARRRFESLARELPEVRAAALLWQGRVSALTEVQAPVAPAPAVWTRIANLVRADDDAQRMAAARGPAATALPWWQRLGWWQGATAAGSLAAVLAFTTASALRSDLSAERQQVAALQGSLGQAQAALSARDTEVSALQQELARAPRVEYVAVLNDQKASPALLITFDPANNRLHVQRVGGYEEAPDKSLQLWALPPGAAPRSLGVLNRERLLQLAADRSAVAEVPALAISLEPQGGVPSERGPTGPVLFSGALIQKQL